MSFLVIGVFVSKPSTNLYNNWKGQHSDVQRGVSNPVYYMQLLVFVDHQLFETYNKNEVEVRSYVMSFWKGVHENLKMIKDVDIRISIAGIIIAKSIYETRNYLKQNDGTYDLETSLSSFGEYLYKEGSRKTLPTYDVAVQMVKCDRNCAEKNRDHGIAYVGGACKTRNNQVLSSAIVLDNGVSGNIPLAAHEIGNLLGANHDGATNADYGNIHETNTCREDRYIMNATATHDRCGWSSCSMEAIRQFLKSHVAGCFLDSHKDDLADVPLPGEVLSLDDQCRKLSADRAYVYNETVCTKLWCFFESRSWTEYYGPAAAGSNCGDNGGYCIGGKCVPRGSNNPSRNGK